MSVLLLTFFIILSIGLMLFYYFKRIQLTKKVKNLNKNFYEPYKLIIEKLDTEPLLLAEKKEIYHNVLEIFLKAQNNNLSVDKLIGNDIDSFIIKIKNSYNYRNSLPWNIFNSIQISILFIFFIQIFPILETGKFQSTFLYKTNGWLITFFLTIAFILIPMVNTALKKKKSLLMIFEILLFSILFIGFEEILKIVAPNSNFVNYFFNDNIKLMPNQIYMLIYILLLPICFLAKQFIRKFSLKKYNIENII